VKQKFFLSLKEEKKKRKSKVVAKQANKKLTAKQQS
jgi:hypothetical protein